MTMNQITKVTEDLKEVKRLIVECGWIRGSLKRDGCYCLDGAVVEATGFPLMDILPGVDSSTNHAEAFQHLRNNKQALNCVVALCSHINTVRSGHQVLFIWNDSRRNQQEVIDLLDHTIKSLED
jgi:hypothetical protein